MRRLFIEFCLVRDCRRLWILLSLGFLAAVGCDRSSVELDESPQRIVAIAPSISEMLFELGFGDRVVGVGDFAKWPPQVEVLPRLGGLFDPRLETVASLQPDLAILLPSEENLGIQLRQLDIDVMTVSTESLEDIEMMAIAIADRLGEPEKGDEFVQRWRMRLQPTVLDRSIRVLMPVARQSGRVADIVLAGPNTFLDELLSLAGAENSMAGAELSYPQVGLEEILSRQPDVVLELQPSPGIYDDLVDDWADLGGSDVLTQTCVRVIAGDHVLIPGPRVPRLYDEIREALASCAGSSELSRPPVKKAG